MKDFTREYATAAFRFYAREGGVEKYIEKKIDEVRQKKRNPGLGNPTEADIVRRDQVIREYAAELADIEAAEKAMLISEKTVRQAVEIVYMRDCWKDLKKGDIEARVHTAEIYIPASRAQIYRWLAKFARERGLRL